MTESNDQPFLFGHPDFEAALERCFSAAIEDDDQAIALWSAMTNIVWSNGHVRVLYSFRGAGGVIAGIRGHGDYLDWYCCGPWAQVSDEIAEAMAREGWTWERAD